MTFKELLVFLIQAFCVLHGNKLRIEGRHTEAWTYFVLWGVVTVLGIYLALVLPP